MPMRREINVRAGIVSFFTNQLPVICVKLNMTWCQQFLQSPSSGIPAAHLERLLEAWWVVLIPTRHIWQVRIADFGVLVVLVHAIDGFWEFSATSFVDRTRIDPSVEDAIFERPFAACNDFSVACFSECTVFLLEDLGEGNLLGAPSIRKNRVLRDVLADEVFELDGCGVEEPHSECYLRQRCDSSLSKSTIDADEMRWCDKLV